MDPCNPSAFINDLRAMARDELSVPTRFSSTMTHGQVCDAFTKCKNATSLPPMKLSRTGADVFYIDRDSPLTARDYKQLFENGKVKDVRRIAKKVGIIRLTAPKIQLLVNIKDILRRKKIQEPIKLPLKTQVKATRNKPNNNNNNNLFKPNNNNNNSVPKPSNNNNNSVPRNNNNNLFKPRNNNNSVPKPRNNNNNSVPKPSNNLFKPSNNLFKPRNNIRKPRVQLGGPALGGGPGLGGGRTQGISDDDLRALQQRIPQNRAYRQPKMRMPNSVVTRNQPVNSNKKSPLIGGNEKRVENGTGINTKLKNARKNLQNITKNIG